MLDPEDLALRVYPDPVLKKEATPFELPLPENIHSIGEKMLDIMYQEGGIGLAGNQAGLTRRIIVFDLSEDQTDPNILINPEIVFAEKKKVDSEEGCLSFPEIKGTVKRSPRVTVEGLNADGNKVSFEADELLAAMFQHEIDHLDGITFVDRLGVTSKMRIRKDLNHLEEDFSAYQS